MNNQVLYDKIISVTLYRPPHMIEARYTTQVVMGYGTTVAKGPTRGERSRLDQVRDIPLSGRNPITTRIEFYEGQVEKVFIGYKTDDQGHESAVYKSVQPSGNVYFVNTIEDMRKGRASDGTVFKTGDRIRVKDEGSVWTAVIREGVGEAQLTAPAGTILVEEPAETLHIDCTDEGLKPDMSLTISLLPGQNCYNAILKIRNLNLESKNIRLWTRMVITAGYRTGATATYTCPIFASYIEEPNPDGITVFEGITVGVAEDILNNRYTEIMFVQEKMKLIDLVKGVAEGISSGITVECAIDDEIMNKEINISKQTVYAQNGAAILNWLQVTISQFIQTISSDTKSGPISAFLQLVNDTLQIIALNGPNKKPEAVENVISLDMISGATFNSTALTVIAPWNPALQPGNLFYMPPEFINGSKLPNVLPETDYRNEDNLYRALTISVTFASVENANKMEVLAVPAQWAGQLPSNRTTSMTADTLAQVLSNDITNHQSIKVGKTDTKEVAEVRNAKPKGETKTHTFDDNEGLIGQWGAWTKLDVDNTKGNCLSTILEYYFFDDPNGPRLKAGEKGIQDESAYYRDKQYFIDEGNTLAATHVQNSGCKANVLWWPLTMVGTYWRKKKDDEAHAVNNWDRIDPKDPNTIHAGRALYIPNWATSWESQLTKMQQIRDIWKWAYIEYGKLYGPLCVMWRAMYYYLGGTDDIG